MASSTPSTYRGRFAPSPTGPLHFGSLVAAVGSLLQARSQQGKWLLRMEDLDPPREVAGAADNILRTLEAFGMYWDADIMYQSQRTEAYEQALDLLAQQQHSYPCTCSRREIDETASAGIEGNIYPGTCRITPAKPESEYALRIRTKDEITRFHDSWQGVQQQNLYTDIGDFIVKRKDSLYAYQLAVVVDDAAQGITEIVRGSDLLGSTPRQIYLQQLLAYTQPRYAHLPMAVTAQQEKLSKHTHAPAVDPKYAVTHLIQVLEFLQQAVDPGLPDASVDEFWAWAIKNWQPDAVPARYSIEAPVST